ncbi:MAG: WhiB family transcriptional regulator [Phycicoccus sp.]
MSAVAITLRPPLREVTEDDIKENGWGAYAACRGVDPDVMFPESRAARKTAPSKRICGGCPEIVRDACLEERGGERWGTVGGLTEWEREAIRTRRRKQRQRAREKQAAA